MKRKKEKKKKKEKYSHRPLDPKVVLDYFCSRLDIPKWILQSKERRNKDEVRLRKTIVLLLLELTDLNHEGVANLINRKRPLVNYYEKTFKNWDHQYVADYKKIKEEIRNLYE